VVDLVRRRLCQATGPARRAKAAPLAADGNRLAVAAVVAAQAQEAVGEDAAFQEGTELVPHKQRRIGASHGLSLLEEGGGVLLHQAVQRGLLGAVALVASRGAFGHPAGLPGDGLHTRLPRLRPRTVPSRALRLNRPVCGRLLSAHCCGDPFGGHGVCATGCFGATSSGQRMSLMGRNRKFAGSISRHSFEN